MIFAVLDKVTHVELTRYAAAQATEFSGFTLTDYDHVEVPEIPIITLKFGGRRLLTKLEFRSLFPEAALKAIDRFEVQFEQAEYLTDDQKDTVRTSFKDYNASGGVDLDDPRWGPGLGLYVNLGYLTAEEVVEVLNG